MERSTGFISSAKPIGCGSFWSLTWKGFKLNRRHDQLVTTAIDMGWRESVSILSLLTLLCGVE